jgi:putative phage-type endonuclease
MNQQQLYEWRLARKKGIGGSDAAAVCGMSKWKTPLDVYRDKISDDVSHEMTNDQLMGTLFEPVLINYYEKVTGNKVEKVGMTSKDFMIANVDGFIKSENKILEIKTARFMDGWGDEGTDEIPDEYLFQVAHYCHVLDIDNVDIAVLFMGKDFKIYRYTRNKNLEAKLVAKEAYFWNEHVKALKAPAPVNYDEVRTYWKGVSGKSKQATPDIFRAAEALKELKEQSKIIEAKEKCLKQQIMEYMQDAEVLVNGDDRLITWKNQLRTSLDTKALKDANPELAAQFARQAESRTFLVK